MLWANTWLLLVVYLSGCRHYTSESQPVGNIGSVCIDAVGNDTSEPRLGVFAREKLAEQIQRDGSIRLKAKSEADARIDVIVHSFDLRGIGETRVRSANEDLRSYRPVVFGVVVKLEFQVTDLAANAVLIPWTKVDGAADFSELVDIDVVRQDGYRRAVSVACQKIVSAIVDPW